MRKKKLGPEMKDLVGKIQFTDEELDTMQANLDEAGVKLPAFSEVSQRVEEEVQNVESVVEKETVPSGDKHYKDNESKIILCQSQIRMQLVRRQYLRRKKELEANVPKFIKLQASIRGFLIRKRIKSRKEFFHSKIESIKA
ncbi:hypothetical protein HMI55_000700 [Coelomomyces lativittatus]|nr:hypothetical protein HMI55_000700 [Coelomomyces lativittatus]